MLTSENISTFIYPIPPLAQESTWDPIISFKYEVKVFEELTIMKVVEGLRSDYNNMWTVLFYLFVLYISYQINLHDTQINLQ